MRNVHIEQFNKHFISENKVFSPFFELKTCITHTLFFISTSYKQAYLSGADQYLAMAVIQSQTPNGPLKTSEHQPNLRCT